MIIDNKIETPKTTRYNTMRHQIDDDNRSVKTSEGTMVMGRWEQLEKLEASIDVSLLENITISSILMNRVERPLNTDSSEKREQEGALVNEFIGMANEFSNTYEIIVLEKSPTIKKTNTTKAVKHKFRALVANISLDLNTYADTKDISELSIDSIDLGDTLIFDNKYEIKWGGQFLTSDMDFCMIKKLSDESLSKLKMLRDSWKKETGLDMYFYNGYTTEIRNLNDLGITDTK